MKWHLALEIPILLFLLLLAGCARSTVVGPEDVTPELVWPKPPETPRILFLYTITRPKDVNIDPGMFRKIVNFIKGGTQQRIVQPYGIARDTEGRLYVVDTFYKFVHVFDGENTAYYAFPDKQIEGFLNPIDIAVGANGRLYVSDSESKVIHIFTEHGKKYIQSIGRDQLKRPTGLAVNKKTGELLVVDTLASRLVVYDETDLHVRSIVGKDGIGKDSFHYPTSIAVSKEGLVYVTDALNFRVQVLNPDLKFVKTFGAAGDSPGYFSRPKGVATDSQGHIYVVDALFDNVQIFDKDGRLLLSFGAPGNKRGEFWLPNAIFIDEHDRIYISDSYNQRVQVFQYLKEEARRP